MIWPILSSKSTRAKGTFHETRNRNTKMSVPIDWRDRLKNVLSADYPWLRKLMLSHNTNPSSPTNRAQVVALSGGKDSTAMALALAYFEPGNYRYAITPTGNELPDMVEHWQNLEAALRAPLENVGNRTLMGLILEQRALPNHRARWCTRLLKLEPYYKWLATLGPVISYVGLRADEESRPGMIFPDVGEIEMDFAMRRWGWTLEDVLAFLGYLGVVIPERSDCALCFWNKLGELYKLWKYHRDLYNQGIYAEKWVSGERGYPVTFRSPQRDSWPASLADLAKEFEAGRIPTRSLAMMDKRRLVGVCRACTL